MKKYRVPIFFFLMGVLMLFIYPREGKFRYDYQIGRPWVYETLIAPIDFPLLKSEEEILLEKEQKAADVIDYYDLNQTIGVNMVSQFNKAAVSAGLSRDFTKECVEWLSEAYSKGIVSEFRSNTSQDNVIFIKKNRTVTQNPAADVYELHSAYDRMKVDLGIRFPDADVDSLLNLCQTSSYIAPNLFFDEETTRLVHKEAVSYISPSKGMVYSGQLIVSKGETVTAYIAQMLDSYKAEYRLSFGYSGTRFSLFVEHLLMTALIVFLLFATILFVDRKLFERTNELLFLMILTLLSFVVTVILFRIDQKLLYLFPFAIFVTYAGAFFKRNLVFPVYVISLLPLLLIAESGIALFVINLVGGAVAMIAFSRFSRGWLQFVNALFIFLAMALVRTAFHLASGEMSSAVLLTRDLGFLAVNAILVIVLYPFVFILERVLSLVSYTHLLDLVDTNLPLLQELQRKAPGTFQHSLQVANLAQNAARTIGADQMLVRVGALYHDIGKTLNPMCFVENQTEGVEYHKSLTAEESARQIIRHVDDGVALAKKHSLPDIVTSFIETHHGTSMVAYFYNVYCNAGGDPMNKAPFTYNGKRPETKEQVIIMMADSVEAASRTLKNYNEESISEMVEKILAGKITGEQLAGAEISLKEIETVKESFKSYIRQIYHARISYPERKQVSKSGKRTGE